MRPNALRALAALDGPKSLSGLARAARLPLASASRAASELEGLGFVVKQREGVSVRIAPASFGSFMALRNELVRHPRLDLSRAVHGKRAAVVAGLGAARPGFLRAVAGLSRSSWSSVVRDLDRYGLLSHDRELEVELSPGHEGLREFCQEVCDAEGAAGWVTRGLGGARRLWSRSVEQLLAIPQRAPLPPGFAAGAYTAAAAEGIAFLSGEKFAFRSIREPTWGDVVLQCMLVPPHNRLSGSHAAIMLAARRGERMEALARWYGLQEAYRAVRRFVDGGDGGRWLLPRAEVRAIATRYGVKV